MNLCLVYVFLQVEVLALMDKMCSVVFDGDMKEECLKTVKMEGDRMLDFVAKELKWKKVCPFLGLCPPMKTNVAVEADARHNLACDVCVFATKVRVFCFSVV